MAGTGEILAFRGWSADGRYLVVAAMAFGAAPRPAAAVAVHPLGGISRAAVRRGARLDAGAERHHDRALPARPNRLFNLPTSHWTGPPRDGGAWPGFTCTGPGCGIR